MGGWSKVRQTTSQPATDLPLRSGSHSRYLWRRTSQCCFLVSGSLPVPESSNFARGLLVSKKFTGSDAQTLRKLVADSTIAFGIPAFNEGDGLRFTLQSLWEALDSLKLS